MYQRVPESKCEAVCLTTKRLAVQKENDAKHKRMTPKEKTDDIAIAQTK